VIPIPSTTTLQQAGRTTQPQISAEINTTLPEPANWQLWWALFFDAPPPEIGG
jgi:hypothetical protein